MKWVKFEIAYRGRVSPKAESPCFSNVQFENPVELVRFLDDASRLMIAEKAFTVSADQWSLPL